MSKITLISRYSLKICSIISRFYSNTYVLSVVVLGRDTGANRQKVGIAALTLSIMSICSQAGLGLEDSSQLLQVVDSVTSPTSQTLTGGLPKKHISMRV